MKTEFNIKEMWEQVKIANKPTFKVNELKKDAREDADKKIKSIEEKFNNLVLTMDTYEWNFELLLKSSGQEKKYHQLVEDVLNEEGKRLRIKLKLRSIHDKEK